MDKELHLCLAYLFHQNSMARNWLTGEAIAQYDFSRVRGVMTTKITFEIEHGADAFQHRNTHKSPAHSLTTPDLLILPD